MRVLFLIGLFFLSLPAHSSPYFILKDGPGCYVKSYINRKFFDIDYKKFKGIKLLAEPHKKHKQFMLFRVRDQLYVTKVKCMEKVEVEERFDDVLDSEPEEDYSRYNKIPSYRMENLQINDQQFMIELDYGKTFFSSTEQLFPDYSKFSGSEGGLNFDFDKNAKSSDYKSKGLFALTLGFRRSELAFWTFKIKRYSGEKTDSVNTTFSGTGSGSTVIDWHYQDSFTSLLVGNKFLFLPNSHFRPSIGVHLGICMIETKLKNLSSGDVEASVEGIKFRSTGLSAQLDAGAEYFLSKKFSFGAQYGIEFLGTQKFRLIDTKDNSSNQGFRSRMNYTNTFFVGGVKFYF